MYTWRKVRSIPTWYKGTRFRSKLEASWAEFFTVHRMQWAYEPEGFDFDGVLYLPDFWLPEIKTFVEVKGILEEKDEEKLWTLATAAACQGIMTILAESPVGQGFRIVEPSPQDARRLLSQADLLAGKGVDRSASEDVNRSTSQDINHPIAKVRCILSGFSMRKDVDLALCSNCGRWYFLDEINGWECQACGYYSGDSTFSQLHSHHYQGVVKCDDCGKGKVIEINLGKGLAW